MPVACSFEAPEIAFTISETQTTEPTISLSDSPVSLTSLTPSWTCRFESWIRVLMPAAALAERWARARTSCATTAKPLPASPARAASTLALSASRLIWKAISSIVPMISTILRADSSIRAMAAIALLTI